MNEFRRRGARMARQIILFAQDNRQTPARCVTRNRRAVNTAANDKQVINSHTWAIAERARLANAQCGVRGQSEGD